MPIDDTTTLTTIDNPTTDVGRWSPGNFTAYQLRDYLDFRAEDH